jgi:DNA-binding MarR family transcriptional regulator
LSIIADVYYVAVMERGVRPRDAWQLLFELLMTTRGRIPSVAADCGLSEPQCHVLRLLAPGKPVCMGALAAELACDASNITGIVDRLEARGLIARRPAAHDRRMKTIVLTDRGAKIRADLMERLFEPPEAVARLSVADQRTLCDILRRALQGAPPPTRAGRARR